MVNFVLKYPGEKLYPFFFVQIGSPEDKHIYFQLMDYQGAGIGDEIKLVSAGGGLYVLPAASSVVFPSGHSIVFGRYRARNETNTAADTSLPETIDVYRIFHRQTFVLNGFVSRFNSLEKSARPVQGIIGSEIPFAVFLSDPVTGLPVDLSSFDRVEFEIGNETFDIPDVGGDRIGYLRITIPASISATLTAYSTDFRINLYVGTVINSIAAFSDSLKLG